MSEKAVASYKGVVKGNMVILDKEYKLSDGMRVIVIPEEKQRDKPNFNADPFVHVDKWAPAINESIPADLAHQHDYYLYGTDK